MSSTKTPAWSWRHHRTYWRECLRSMETKRRSSADEFDSRVSMILETGSIFKDNRAHETNELDEQDCHDKVFKMDTNGKIFRRCILIATLAFMAVSCIVETMPSNNGISVKRNAMTGDVTSQQRFTKEYINEDNLSKFYTYVFKLEPRCHWSHEKEACTCAHCTCNHPLIPMKRHDDNALTKNRLKDIDVSMRYNGGPDVVFLGNPTLEWTGGSTDGESRHWQDYAETLFKSSFMSGAFDTVDLSISGDTTTNLLWRIEKENILSGLVPKVIWLSAGANDFIEAGCYKEIVLIGLLKVIEEIRRQRPDSVVVVNSILPWKYGSDGILDKDGKNFFTDTAEVNEELKKYCEKHNNVQFFDANEIFLEDVHASEEELKLQKDLMRQGFQHPNSSGYQAWAKKISERLEEIL